MSPKPPGKVANVARLTAVIFLALTLPLSAGLLADKWQNSSPVWTVAGVIVGSVLATVLLYRSIGRNFDASNPDNNDDHDVKADRSEA